MNVLKKYLFPYFKSDLLDIDLDLQEADLCKCFEMVDLSLVMITSHDLQDANLYDADLRNRINFVVEE